MSGKFFLLIIGLVVLMPLALGDDRDASSESPSAETSRARALRLKHSGRVEERERALELLREVARGDSAAAIEADLEALDLALRLGRLEGVGPRLDILESRWAGSPSVSLRARALRGILGLRLSLFLEPNAVATATVGSTFRERFLQDDLSRKTFRELPLGFPVLFLNDRADARVAAGGKVRAPTVVVLATLEDLLVAEKELVEGVEGGSRLTRLARLASRREVLVIVLAFLGTLPAIEWEGGPPELESLCLLWIPGTFQALEGVPRRTRFEWVPGTSFIRLGPGNEVLSWCLPWDSWGPFERELLEALKAPAAHPRKS